MTGPGLRPPGWWGPRYPADPADPADPTHPGDLGRDDLVADVLDGHRSAHAWLLDGFARRTPGVLHAVTVMAAGLACASSSRLPADRADRLAALTATLASVSTAAARLVGGALDDRAAVELDTAVLLVMPLSEAVTLTVLTQPQADLDHVGYEMAVLGERLLAAWPPRRPEPARVRVIR